jgi:hypothetical protein
MKKNILFKTLIDILFYFHCLALIGVLFILPLGITNINQVNMPVKNWSLGFWFILILNFIIYIIFLIGLFYLRKTARHLLSNNFFTENVINNLKKSGLYFIVFGIASLLLSIGIWAMKLYNGSFQLLYDSGTIIPLFVTIVGLFFLIQSRALLSGKFYKQENDLTI